MDTAKILQALTDAHKGADFTVVAKGGGACIMEVDGHRVVFVGADENMVPTGIAEGAATELVWELTRVRSEVPWNDDEADAARLILQTLEDSTYAVKRHAGETASGRLKTAVWDDFELTNDDGTLAFTYAIVAY